MEEQVNLRVGQKDSGIRLDVFLSEKLGMTRSSVKRLIAEERVRIGGSDPRPALRVKPGMEVQVFKPGPAHLEERLVAQDIPISVIFEDEYILVVDKPAGIVVHPGAGNHANTLVNAILFHVPGVAGVGSPRRPGVVHRLDKLTSGVMVFAKRQDAYYTLADAFKRHEHARKYYALCYGEMPERDGTIRTLIGRHPADRKRMTSMVTRGREAITHWHVHRQWKGFSLVDLSLETGRTHQIRVHLADMGRPIVGDPIYGGKRRTNSILDPSIRTYARSLGRQMLHAYLLGMRHPGTGRWMEFKSDMPQDMLYFIELLDKALL